MPPAPVRRGFLSGFGRSASVLATGVLTWAERQRDVADVRRASTVSLSGTHGTGSFSLEENELGTVSWHVPGSSAQWFQAHLLAYSVLTSGETLILAVGAVPLLRTETAVSSSAATSCPLVIPRVQGGQVVDLQVSWQYGASTRNVSLDYSAIQIP